MTISLALGCVWIVVANAIAMLPSKRNHWPQAWGLIAVGIPLLGYIAYENGPWWGLAALFAGASILRWPIRRFSGWAWGKLSTTAAEGAEARDDTR
jgi:hypothetical protein